MSAAQKISSKYKNSTGQDARAGAVAIVNKGGNKASVPITRPANVTPYTANDVIGIADVATPANAGSAILEFLNAGNVGGFVRINSADLRIDLIAIPGGMAAFTLHLYDDAPDAVLDNAPWDLLSAGDRSKYLGSITLTPLDMGSTLFGQLDNIAKQVKLKDGSTSLFGVLVTAGGYTPASGGTQQIRLNTTEL